MSLRTRLSLSIAALVLVAVAALGVAVYNLVGSRLDDRTDAELAVQADALAQAIAAAPPASEAKAARSYIAGQALAGSRLLILEHSGHFGQVEEPDAFLAGVTWLLAGSFADEVRATFRRGDDDGVLRLARAEIFGSSGR